KTYIDACGVDICFLKKKCEDCDDPCLTNLSPFSKENCEKLPESCKILKEDEQSFCRRKCREGLNDAGMYYDSSNTGSTVPVGAIIGPLCLVIVVIASLITVCYWIHKTQQGNGSKSKSIVRYAPHNQKVDFEGQTSVATQPLPPIPVENNCIPPTLQQNTYEQIDPQYTDLKQDKNATAYTTLQPNSDSIPNCNALKTIKAKSETLLNTNILKDKPTPAYYTMQRDDNSDVNEKSHTTDANDDGEADDYFAKLRQNDIEKESYSKLNHNSCKSVPDDATGDYNKLISTPAFDEESEEYSHLRTSPNVDKCVTDPGYGKLNLSIESGESTIKPNDGYEETLPSEVKTEYVTRESSQQFKDDNRLRKSRAEKANLKNGYEEAIIRSSDQL
ncbi:uncharacterized protein LOC117116769, partial [Anneissia japonica]|uniref:uncharacterized protein LOC117116769 n=1 Tax=Anneissia japonica TaxID=1529436 RepID=UPI00142597C9